MRDVPTGRLLRIKHEHRDIGFLSARLLHEMSCPDAWCLRVESPDDVEEFRLHLQQGTLMSLRLVMRDGRVYSGEACVSSISDSAEWAALVVLAGVGPLHDD